MDDKRSLEEWILQVDDSSNMKGSGVGIYLKTLTGEIIEQSLQLGFKASNNEEEYETMVARLQLAKSLDAKRLKVMSNS